MSKRVTMSFSGAHACFVHSDEAVEVFGDIGTVSMRRASHVEPWTGLSEEARQRFCVDNPQQDTAQFSTNKSWFADLTPVGGNVAGPFASKQAALDYEVEWINQNALTHDVRNPTVSPTE